MAVGSPGHLGVGTPAPARWPSGSDESPESRPTVRFGALAICHWGYGLGLWRGLGRIVLRSAVRPAPTGPTLMPVPAVERLDEYARKGVELLLRTVGEAPEQRAARVLRSQPRAVQPGAPHAGCCSCRRATGPHRCRSRPSSATRCASGAPTCTSSPAAAAWRSATGRTPTRRRRCPAARARATTTCRSRHTGSPSTGYGMAGRAPATGSPGRSSPPRRSHPCRTPGRTDCPWAASSTCRSSGSFRRGPVDRPDGRPHLPRLSPPAGRQVAEGIRTALDELQPDVVVLLSGLFLFEGIAWALCRERGIDVVTYERAFRKDTLVLPAGTCLGRLLRLQCRLAARPT